MRKPRELVGREWVLESDGRRRRRFRGRGVKGPPPASTSDLGDVRLAIRELEGAHADLVAAYALPPSVQRRAAVKAAIGRVALAGRFCDSVVLRRGGRCGDVEP